MLLKTWQAAKFCTGPGWAIHFGTVANRDVGGRAYTTAGMQEVEQCREQLPRDLLVACLRSKCPSRAPRLSHATPTCSSILLGAIIRISYALCMREMTDEQLMQQYAKGDAKAFDELYARHRAPLYRYFNRQVNNVATANDLYQGAWEKIIKARRSYRTSKPFTAWMYRIAHNHLVDHYRRSRPEESVEADVLSDFQPGPAQDAIDTEQNEQLKTGIINLPVEQRNTLLLKLETGLKMEEIASVTGVSRETVKSRLRYAVNKLKRSLVE